MTATILRDGNLTMFRRRCTSVSIENSDHETYSLLDDYRAAMTETELPTVEAPESEPSSGPEQPEAILSTMSPQPRFKSFSYFSSRDFPELLGCLGFLLVISLLSLIDRELNERPIPVQILKASGDYVRNLTNNEPFDGETIPDIWLVILSIVAPVMIRFALSKFWGRPGDGHATWCVYIVAFAIVLVTTDAIKRYVGYLRPIFFELCEPDDTYQECTAEDAGGSSIRMSFPSGHASTSFCGLMLLSLYLHSRFGVPSVRVMYTPAETTTTTTTQLEPHHRGTTQTAYTKEPALYRAISVLSLLPLALALFIATSRIVDNKHFPADVVAGSLLGASTAIFAFSLWFA
jgi:diacylglycerol diphosphate phosphatase/phosphatidate phosphatase